MGALMRLAAFELRQQLRRVSTWVYFGASFLIAFFVSAATAGAWPSLELDTPILLANSPLRIANTLLMMASLGVVVTAALAGNAVYRDFQTGIHPLFFTTPTSKAAYLGGRWLGAVAANLLILLGAPLGMMAAPLWPTVEAGRVAPFDLGAYAVSFAVLVVPTVLLTAAIFVSLAAVTRRMLPNYVGGMVLLLGWAVAAVMLTAVDEEWPARLLDPFAVSTLSRATRYWTVAEQNRAQIPLDRWMIGNRLLWMGVGLAVFALGARAFRFAHVPERRREAQERVRRQVAEAAPAEPLAVPTVRRDFSARARREQLAAETRRAVREVVANGWFPLIIAICLFFVAVTSSEMGTLYGTRTFPVTYQVLDSLSGSFGLFVLIIITFYSGELVWNERELRSAQIHDSLPVPDWIPLAARLLGLMGVVAALMAAVMVLGVMIQLARGWTRFDFGVYLRELFLMHLLGFYLPLVVLSVLVQTVVNHKYVGHFIMLGYYVALAVVSSRVEHHALVYGTTPSVLYSDMNGYGHAWVAFTWFALYWGLVALLLAALTNLLWVRGQGEGVRRRLRLARLRLTRPLLAASAVAVVLVLATGGFIVYNTNVLNDFETRREGRDVQVEYEELYKRYEWVPQPRLTRARLSVDLYPDRRDLRIRGTYRLVNRTAVPIDSVHVDVLNSLTVREMAFGRPSRRVWGDRARGYYIYRLDAPLAPGDSVEMRFHLEHDERGFENDPQYGPVVGNGTFFNSQYLPKIGYNAEGEIADPTDRARAGLPPRPRAASLHDRRARTRNFVSYDADWIDFEATVSTSADQVAVAPGVLEREWREGGRRHFRYRMDAPMLNFYAFLSARYAVRRDAWVDLARGDTVAIEVYHHPEHAFNVERMVRSVKASLAYYTREFGPYQHRQVRIFEFPRYAAFAQSFANTIPYSESIGFIADVKGDDLDYPFFVTAHEVAHQWWGHQVAPANVQGAAMLSETLAEYSALMVMEKEYGREQIGRFLRHELDGYLRGRGTERLGETPLYRVEGQAYIHYNKGALAMYALRDYVGEQAVNRALRAFLDEQRLKGPPYPTSLDLLRHLRAAVPDSLRGVVRDLFERVTLWDNRAVSATARPVFGGRWEVELTVRSSKLRADSLGNETRLEEPTWIDVGVFAADSTEPVYLRKHRILPGERTVRVTVSQWPQRAGIDPLNKLIDRKRDDNVVEVRIRREDSRDASRERSRDSVRTGSGASSRDTARGRSTDTMRTRGRDPGSE
jgi:ABC-2 type transport system permease protein